MWWHLIWIVPLIMVIIIIVAMTKNRNSATHTAPSTSTKGEHATKETPKKGMGFFVSAYKLVGLVAICIVLFVACFLSYRAYNWVVTPTPPPRTEPYAGEEWVHKEVGLLVWLDSRVTCTRPSGPVVYINKENPDIRYEDLAGDKLNHNIEKWKFLPVGYYYVYPLNADKIYFRWWQR